MFRQRWADLRQVSHWKDPKTFETKEETLEGNVFEGRGSAAVKVTNWGVGGYTGKSRYNPPRLRIV